MIFAVLIRTVTEYAARCAERAQPTINKFVLTLQIKKVGEKKGNEQRPRQQRYKHQIKLVRQTGFWVII